MAMNIDDLDFNDDDPIIQNINNDDGSQQPDFDSLDQEKPWLDGTEGGKSTNSSPAEPEPKQEPEIEEDIILSIRFILLTTFSLGTEYQRAQLPGGKKP